MKTRILSLVLPVAAFMLASAGAVGSSLETSDSSTPPVPGWSRNAQNHCLVQAACKTEIDDICTVASGAQAFGMVAPNQCTQTLYKR